MAVFNVHSCTCLELVSDLLNILDGCLSWKLDCLFMSALDMKNLLEEIGAINHKRSCMCLICPCMFAGAGIWPVNTDQVLIRLSKLTAEKQAESLKRSNIYEAAEA